MSAIVPLAALGALVFTFVNTLRFLVARDWSAVVTQLVAWLAGVLGIFLLQATDFAAALRIGDLTLDRVGFWSTILLGLMVTSVLSMLNQVKKAVDRTDSARVPPLLPSATGHSATRHGATGYGGRPDPTKPGLPDMFRQLSC